MRERKPFKQGKVLNLENYMAIIHILHYINNLLFDNY